MKTKSILFAVGISAFSFLVSPLSYAKDEKAKPYPLTTCIVSDETLGEMGKPVVFVYKGQEIKLCCKSCRKDFNKDPKQYLKKLTPKT